MSDEAYEAPKSRRVDIETASGPALDVLAEAVYGLRRRPAVPGQQGETDALLRARCHQLDAREAATSVMSAADVAELRWWRSQFATRFPQGQLPKPGTALLGRRFQLSEGTPSPRPSFHLGVDLGADGKADSTILSLVQDGQVVAYARIDVGKEMHAFGAAMRPYQALFHVIEREAKNLVNMFAARPELMLLCVGNCGKSTRAMTGQIAWVCADCVATRNEDRLRAPGEVRAGDIWVDEKTGKTMELHSYVESQDFWNVIVDRAQVTTSMTAGFIAQPGHVLAAIKKRPPTQSAEPAQAPAQKPPVVETSPPCCRIGGEMHQLMRPCPFHDRRAPEPAYGNGEFDTYGFLRP